MCKQHTAPRAFVTCHTRICFSCPRGSRCLRYSVECSLCVSQKAIPSHPCFVAPCLIHSCPHISPRPFLHFAPGASPFPSLLYPSVGPSTVTLHAGLCLGRLAEKSPLTCSRHHHARILSVHIVVEHIELLHVQFNDKCATNLCLPILVEAWSPNVPWLQVESWCCGAWAAAWRILRDVKSLVDTRFGCQVLGFGHSVDWKCSS